MSDAEKKIETAAEFMERADRVHRGWSIRTNRGDGEGLKTRVGSSLWTDEPDALDTVIEQLRLYIDSYPDKKQPIHLVIEPAKADRTKKLSLLERIKRI